MTLEDTLELEKEQKRKLELIKKAEDILLREGFTLDDFMVVRTYRN
jgi:hypothetical protein